MNTGIKSIFTTLILLFLLSGCDSYIRISITNTKNEAVEIWIKKNIHFRSDKLSKFKKNGFLVYELVNGERMDIGYAIAEIDDDLPFDAIKIYTKTDTISKSTNEDIKDLFDKKMFGGLQTPYNISIK